MILYKKKIRYKRENIFIWMNSKKLQKKEIYPISVSTNDSPRDKTNDVVKEEEDLSFPV